MPFIFIGTILSAQKTVKSIWSPNISYSDIVTKAQSGDPYYQGLLGIYLRSGEAGCAVNLKLARDWSQVSWAKGHPFGAYNLANLAILKETLKLLPNSIKMLLCSCNAEHRMEMQWQCIAWGKSTFK